MVSPAVFFTKTTSSRAVFVERCQDSSTMIAKHDGCLVLKSLLPIFTLVVSVGLLATPQTQAWWNLGFSHQTCAWDVKREAPATARRFWSRATYMSLEKVSLWDCKSVLMFHFGRKNQVHKYTMHSCSTAHFLAAGFFARRPTCEPKSFQPSKPQTDLVRKTVARCCKVIAVFIPHVGLSRSINIHSSCRVTLPTTEFHGFVQK